MKGKSYKRVLELAKCGRTWAWCIGRRAAPSLKEHTDFSGALAGTPHQREIWCCCLCPSGRRAMPQGKVLQNFHGALQAQCAKWKRRCVLLGAMRDTIRHTFSNFSSFQTLNNSPNLSKICSQLFLLEIVRTIIFCDFLIAWVTNILVVRL